MLDEQNEQNAREVLRAWVAGRPGDAAADVAARATLQALAPGVAGGMVVQTLAARARQKALLNDPLPARVVRALLDDGRPELMLALGFLTHWPRFPFSSRPHDAAFAKAARGAAPVDWRTLLLQRMGGELGAPFSLAGSTARGEGRDAAYLRAALLERAMNLGVAWAHDAWAARVAPAVGAPIFWLLWRSAESASVLYGPREGGFFEAPLEPRPRPPLPKLRPRARRAPPPPEPPPPAAPYVRVLHPAELAPEQRAALAALVEPGREPFEQIHRAVYAPAAGEAAERGVRRYRDREIEETVLFGYLRRRGWRRGEIMDYARFFEMHLSAPEAEWRPYLRISPGIDSGGPEPGRVGAARQRIELVAFQRRGTPGPPWGGRFVRRERGRPDAMADEVALSTYETPEGVYGERLGDVAPAVYSEALRAVERLYAKGAPGSGG